MKPRQLLNRLSASSSICSAEIHRPNLYTHSVRGSAWADSAASDPLWSFPWGQERPRTVDNPSVAATGRDNQAAAASVSRRSYWPSSSLAGDLA